MMFPKMYSVIILCMHPANDRWGYNITSFLIGWGLFYLQRLTETAPY